MISDTVTPQGILAIIKEKQSLKYKESLELCLTQFPMTSISDVQFSKQYFSRIPKAFTQRLFVLFPKSIPFII